MFYFSPILGKKIKNENGDQIGKVFDMIIVPGESFPNISDIIMKFRTSKKIIPWKKVKHLDMEGLITRGTDSSYGDYQPNGEILLGRDILDKQLVDINGHRVVRVNDIQLNKFKGNLILAGVDVGPQGLLRRLGLLNFARTVFKLKPASQIIRWDNVDLPGKTGQALRLTTTNEKLTRIHPADLADILEELSAKQRVSLFNNFDMEQRAEILEHMEEDVQLALFRTLSDEIASDILEEMSPDEAADLLQDLPEYRANELLGLMEPDEAEDVKELLTYKEDTAGGYMSTEYISISPHKTCQEAIEHIRMMSPKTELVYYVYVVDSDETLLGIISIRDLIINEPTVRISDIMVTEIIFIEAEEDINKVVELIAKYDLLAVPVVDKSMELKGIVTFDDVMDILIPPEKR
ncbi:MAG: magnesium transporter [Vulcanimicrobiota bacterium]